MTLELVPGWDGHPRWRCPVCGTHGDGSHVPDSDVCLLLVGERSAKCRD